MDRSLPVILAALAGCAGPTGARDPDPFADVQRATDVVSAPSETGEGFHDAHLATNGVRGGGDLAGSLDVYSISLDEGDELVLRFDAPVPDDDGVDLVVFENPFDIAGGGRFMDPTIVEVSEDGVRFLAFPHRYGSPEYVDDPALWQGFAGTSPVHLHEEDHPVDPLSEEAGGDAFDLSDLEEPLDEILFVRLSAAALAEDPETGLPFPSDRASDGPDIDGVYGRIR